MRSCHERQLASGRVLATKARSSRAEAAVFHARELLAKVGFAPAWRQIVEVLRLSHNGRVIGTIFSFSFCAFELWDRDLKHWIKSNLNTPIQSQVFK
jgi:hypothetical protein